MKHKPSKEMIHYEHMLYYAERPELFGLQNIESYSIEPTWFRHEGKKLTKQHESLCDIIFFLEDRYWGQSTGRLAVPVEIKRSRGGRSKAIKQLRFGKQYIEEILQREAPFGAIGYYAYGKHEVEQYEF